MFWKVMEGEFEYPYTAVVSSTYDNTIVDQYTVDSACNLLDASIPPPWTILQCYKAKALLVLKE